MGTDPIRDALTLARSITGSNNQDSGGALASRPAAAGSEVETQRIEKRDDEVPPPSPASNAGDVFGQSPQPPDYQALRARVLELEARENRTRKATNERVKRYRARLRAKNGANDNTDSE